jgi:hypothetical protein
MTGVHCCTWKALESLGGHEGSEGASANVFPSHSPARSRIEFHNLANWLFFALGLACLPEDPCEKLAALLPILTD